MKYHVVSVLLILSAFALYMGGFSNAVAGTGVGAFLCTAGVFCDVSFWVRVLRRKTGR